MQKVWMFYEVKNHVARSEMPYREMVKEMSKEEAVKIMLDSINEDNLAFGIQAGLKEADLKLQIEQSQPSLGFMMSNIYDKLKAGNVIA
jgi:hypothetical protein